MGGTKLVMTVKELMQLLATMPQDAEVLHVTDNFDDEINMVRLRKNKVKMYFDNSLPE